MYDINYKNLKRSRLLGLPFLLVGLVLFTAFMFVTFQGHIKKQKFDSQIKATSIEGNCHTDSDGDYLCSPVYIFEVDGIPYSCHTSFSSSSKPKSNQDTVYYDSNDPTNCVTEYEARIDPIALFASAFCLIFVGLGIGIIVNGQKKINKVKYLAQNGTLYQGLHYEMIPSNITVNNVPLLAPTIDFTLPNGVTVKLVGEARHDRKFQDGDGLVDLLIDLNDPSNYFIDFEIKKKTDL